ncbi:hypothetical protein [Hydrogenophaga defluvii]|uniref:Uncharacterized protein n=1 Tax=Hydrogenophaga defluvii TaxID=249410 RepID=A0ABW2SAM7_9BURK
MHQELYAQTNRPLHRSVLVRIGAQVVTIALAIALLEPALAQDAKKPPPTKPTKSASVPKPEPARPQPVKYDFLEAQEYITKINAIAEPQPRGEFESREAYEARQPKLADAASTLLRIERGYKDYSYDIDKKVLTIRVPVAKIKPRKSLNGLPLQAAYSIDKKEEYTGSNSYGAKVTVEKTWSTSYLLFVPPEQVNSMLKETENPILATLPESMRARMADSFKERTISVDISAEPRDAERISKNYVVLFRVRPKGLQFSVFEATQSTKPTISEPKDSTLFTRAIEVDLLEIVVRDGPMGPELLRQPIGVPLPSPASDPASSVTTDSPPK